MPFGVTVAGDMFQHELDQCFRKIKQVIVIADDIMIVGKKSNHSDHDQALTTLLGTARRCNVKLNYEKLQYKKDEVDFFGETFTRSGHEPDASKHKRLRYMFIPRCAEGICCNWNRIACSCLGYGNISQFLVCKPFHSWDWPKASWSNFVKTYQPNNTQIARHFDQAIPSPFYSVIYTRIVKPGSRLLVPIGWPKGHYQVTKTSCLPDY